MNKVNEQRMKLRIEYSRETDLIFSDNIPLYADWLEKKLALQQHHINKNVCDDHRADLEHFVNYSESICKNCKEKI